MSVIQIVLVASIAFIVLKSNGESISNIRLPRYWVTRNLISACWELLDCTTVCKYLIKKISHENYYERFMYLGRKKCNKEPKSHGMKHNWKIGSSQQSRIRSLICNLNLIFGRIPATVKPLTLTLPDAVNFKTSAERRQYRTAFCVLHMRAIIINCEQTRSAARTCLDSTIYSKIVEQKNIARWSP